MPHARAAEAVGLAKMVTHVRVGMSAALGWLVRLDRPKEALPTYPTDYTPAASPAALLPGTRTPSPTPLAGRSKPSAQR
jgi:hypothetical protein